MPATRPSFSDFAAGSPALHSASPCAPSIVAAPAPASVVAHGGDDAGGCIDRTGVFVPSERVAEIRAAWRADRRERWAAFREHWPMHLVELALDASWGFCLGVVLALSILIWALEAVA